MLVQEKQIINFFFYGTLRNKGKQYLLCSLRLRKPAKLIPLNNAASNAKCISLPLTKNMY